MIKSTGFLSLVILIICNCGTKAQTDKRKEIIAQFLAAIEASDTSQLFSIVDTSEFFDVQGKDFFLHEINYMRERFVECSSIISDSSIKIKQWAGHYTDYTYLFCRGKDERITNDSFDVTFTFADFKQRDKMYSMHIKHYLSKMTPTDLPSTQAIP